MKQNQKDQGEGKRGRGEIVFRLHVSFTRSCAERVDPGRVLTVVRLLFSNADAFRFCVA